MRANSSATTYGRRSYQHKVILPPPCHIHNLHTFPYCSYQKRSSLIVASRSLRSPGRLYNIMSG
ncbi:hypothetical protein [Nostoc sp. ChiQUE01b]|uniref:hypothetical protein n=1 Tax=Nostoc sp. ChiQUE01b TaxID=3075376 RepID=UPI002AD30FFD|nr:hypothetical protein [Nostoc sp. ChiQUE01b]